MFLLGNEPKELDVEVALKSIEFELKFESGDSLIFALVLMSEVGLGFGFGYEFELSDEMGLFDCECEWFVVCGLWFVVWIRS